MLSLAEALGLFEPQQLTELGQMFARRAEESTGPGPFWLVDDDGGGEGLGGVSYCEPERMTEGSWNLQFIGIRPNLQRQGRGVALVHAVEQALHQRHARLLLVETAASAESNHIFYACWGFEKEAIIRDFYAAGEDKVVFRKDLKAPRTGLR